MHERFALAAVARTESGEGSPHSKSATRASIARLADADRALHGDDHENGKWTDTTDIAIPAQRPHFLVVSPARVR
jgi:hypothetical protein